MAQETMTDDLVPAWQAATAACLEDGEYAAPETPEQWAKVLSAAFAARDARGEQQAVTDARAVGESVVADTALVGTLAGLPDHVQGVVRAYAGLCVRKALKRPQPAAPAPVSPEDRFEDYVQSAIAASPAPLRELGEYLTRVLDEDEWPTAESFLLQLATTPAPVAGDAAADLTDDLDFEPDEDHAIADMANVGYSLMQAIKSNCPGYCWGESPAEIVVDLINARDAAAETFQTRVAPWMQECFGATIASDVRERGDRLLEEVLELLQSHGYDPDRVATLREYVFGRPVGEPQQEVGGVMVTLAAYCLATGIDMHAAGDSELSRISVPEWVERIRAKQASKRGLHTPLPVPPSAPQPAAGPNLTGAAPDGATEAGESVHGGGDR